MNIDSHRQPRTANVTDESPNPMPLLETVEDEATELCKAPEEVSKEAVEVGKAEKPPQHTGKVLQANLPGNAPGQTWANTADVAAGVAAAPAAQEPVQGHPGPALQGRFCPGAEPGPTLDAARGRRGRGRRARGSCQR